MIFVFKVKNLKNLKSEKLKSFPRMAHPYSSPGLPGGAKKASPRAGRRAGGHSDIEQTASATATGKEVERKTVFDKNCAKREKQNKNA